MYYLTVCVGQGSQCGSAVSSGSGSPAGCSQGVGHGYCVILRLQWEESPSVLTYMIFGRICFLVDFWTKCFR